MNFFLVPQCQGREWELDACQNLAPPPKKMTRQRWHVRRSPVLKAEVSFLGETPLSALIGLTVVIV